MDLTPAADLEVAARPLLARRREWESIFKKEPDLSALDVQRVPKAGKEFSGKRLVDQEEEFWDQISLRGYCGVEV